MYALISKLEVINNFDGTTGYRVAEVAQEPFEVANPLYWESCDNTVIPDMYYFDTTQNKIILAPEAPPEPTIIAPAPEGDQPVTTGVQNL